MRKFLRSLTLILVVLTLAMPAGCAGNWRQSLGLDATPPAGETEPSPTGPSAANTGQAAILPAENGEGRLPLKHANGEDYVDAGKLIETIGFKCAWENNNQVLKFGENDAAFEIRKDSTEARKEEDSIRLKTAPVVIDGALHIPVSALADLLREDVVFAKEGEQLVLLPSAEQIQLGVDQDGPLPEGNALDFGDDADDPYKNVSTEVETWAVPDALEDSPEAIPAAALKDINIPALIARARTYLGVKYEFGANPYADSGRFDCSSYTQYLFGKYGITLPRTARAQAKLGNSVSRSSLRVGDLLYFYVPGRFKTNNTVGHVGIYIGNGNMIHSSPLPEDGVQITNIDKAYWKETFLYAKRIAE